MSFLLFSCRQSTDLQEKGTILERLENVEQFMFSNPDSALAVVDAIWHENERRLTDKERWAVFLRRCLINAKIRSDFDTAEADCNTALEIAEQTNDSLKLAETIDGFASLNLMRGNLQSALDYLYRAKLLYGDRCRERIINVYTNLGFAYILLGNSDMALHYLRTAIRESRITNNVRTLAAGYSHLAGAFLRTGDFPQAEVYIRRSASLVEELQDYRNLLTAFANLATLMSMQSRFEEAEKYARKSDNIAKSMGVPAVALHGFYTMRGQGYIQAGNFQSGLELLYKALNLAIRAGNLHLRASLYNYLSEAYRLSQNLVKSEFYLNRVLEVAHFEYSTTLYFIALRNLVAIYAARGDMPQFEAAMNRLEESRRSLFTQERARQLQEVEAELRTEQKRLLIAQKEEIMVFRRTRAAILLAISVLIILFFAHIVVYQKKKMRNIIRIVQQDELLAEYEEQECQRRISNVSGAMKKLSDDLLHLFDEEKIYRKLRLSVDEVAKMLGTNNHRLSTLLNQEYRTPFNDFVNMYRISEAREVLRAQDEGGEYANYTIQAVAEMVGFRSLSSFYAAFRQAVGVTPTEYKEAVRRMRLKAL